MSIYNDGRARAAKECTVVRGDLRITVLTDRMLRVERCAGGVFTDEPTQVVIDRSFAKPQFEVSETDDKIVISTKCVKFFVNKKSLAVECERGGKRVKPSSRSNLGGTARTLDGTFGVVRMLKSGRGKDRFFFANIRSGVMARNGVAELDDSKSLLIAADGSVQPRRQKCTDKYVFAFGSDFAGGLKEYYALTGATPLLPKYALGNWWSRYHAYTQDEYLALMDEFAKRDIPLTVATIDMDWHIVDDVPKEFKPHNPTQCAGWTGYTFNRKLFPDHVRFFEELKARGLAVTMNLHPRDGVRYYEEMYPEMARACGIDPASKKTVEFDLTDEKFRRAYFDILHHPYEKEGVDFWWIDWQQGTKSKMKGLDPLWLLNHYHTEDICRDGKRGIILSRYAGPGSHRYPLGFSGDTMVCWKSLKLQPWFTANAANIGYTWWSHDIGGHMFGKGDPELYVRWLQFGVFSPVNRLHSTKNGISKEPWLYGERAEKIAADFMRLRHRLLPYLYTANVLTAREGAPICAPMYYGWDSPYAFEVKNEYTFGSELIVAPVTSKAGRDGSARTTVWLPAGRWTDFFTGETVEGERILTLKTPLERIPVFAKEGAIVPMIAEREGNSQTFDALEVRVYNGKGSYTMFDEAGSIDFSVETNGKVTRFNIKPSSDCKTETIKVVFANMKRAHFSVREYLSATGNSVTVPCREAEILAEEVPSPPPAEEA